MPEAAPEAAIGEELAPVPLERVSGRPQAFGRQVRGLELLDQPVARLALDAAVEPARQDGGPALDRDAGLQVHLAAVGPERLPARREDPRVHLRADAEPPPPVSPVEADAAESLLLGQLPDVDLEGPRSFVEVHCGWPDLSACATAPGFSAVTRRSARAGPSGWRRPCSQFCNVETLTPIIRANSAWDLSSPTRIALMS